VGGGGVIFSNVAAVYDRRTYASPFPSSAVLRAKISESVRGVLKAAELILRQAQDDGTFIYTLFLKSVILSLSKDQFGAFARKSLDIKGCCALDGVL
jgi:hypothetical protein